MLQERLFVQYSHPCFSWVAAMKPEGLPVLGSINGAIESLSRSL